MLLTDKVLTVTAYHYTHKQPWVWLSLFERGDINVVYVTTDKKQHDCYGKNCLKMELKLPLEEQVPYQDNINNDSPPKDKWGWDEEKSWLHVPAKYMTFIGVE